MGDIVEKKWRRRTYSNFLWHLLPNPLLEILTKHNIKESASKDNIWGTFYILKGEGLGSG